jgi:deazaflavin-dependent oxidoreductase (nitroreductase family)
MADDISDLRKSEISPDDVADINVQIIEAFRANHGVVGGLFEGKRLVLVHHIGRRSGRKYVTPLVGALDGTAYVICGSMGGAPKDPLWIGNIEAGSGQTVIEVGDETLNVRASVVRAPAPEWERLYEIWAIYWPDARDYDKNSSRKFPVVRLEPTA